MPTNHNKDLNRSEWNQSHNQRVINSNSRLSPVVAHSESFMRKSAVEDSFQKNAASIGGGGGGGSTSFSGVDRLAPEIYSPLFTMANLNLPRDRITVNAWLRNFFDLHPIVRNAITLHATYPISKLNIKCPDKKVLHFFEDMIEEMNLFESLSGIALEFWKMGECVRSCNHLTILSKGFKRADEVEVGDLVLTHTGEYKEVLERKINWKHKEYLSITIQGQNEPIELSSNHPIYASKVGNINRNEKRSKIINSRPTFENEDKWEWDWIKSGELSINDFCIIPVNREEEDISSISKDLCRLIGIYSAEGSLDYNSYYNKTSVPKCVVISNTDENLWNYYKPIFKNCNLRLSLNGNNGYLRSNLSKRDATSLFAKKIKKFAGQYSDKKMLSSEIMNLPADKQMEIVNGFIDGDGWIHSGRICMATISRTLAFQIKDILARNYITCSINKHSKNRKNDIYFIEVPLFYANKFNLYKTKQDKLNEEKEKRPLKPNNVPRVKFSKDGHIIAPIKKIERKSLPIGEPLYNFEVDDNHSYCVEGIAVHNCFPYAELDEESGKWSKIIIQNPDYIHVKKTVLAGQPMISLRPDAVLQRLVMSNNPADVQLRKQIPEQILYHVRAGQDIPLDNFNVSHLKMLSSPYDVRGTSVIVSTFKDLMLYDKLREAKFAQADGLVNPITVVKLGGNTDGEYRATQEDLEDFKQMLEEDKYDPDFKLITHAGVDISRVGAQGAVLDIGSDMELIIKNIYTGLMVPPAVVDTESAVYSSASIGLEVLRQRYFNFRNMVANWLQNKIFAPISELNNFFTYDDGRKKLIIPEVEWNKMNLYDLQDYIGNITGLVSQKQASLQTLYKSLGLNYEEERIKQRQELINDVIRQREEQALMTMSLSELRTLNPEKEIAEPVDDVKRELKPGGQGQGADMGGMPGGDMGLGLPGGDLGGMGGGGLPELAPPPSGELGGGGLGGAGAPEGGSNIPPLGPGSPTGGP